MTDRELLELAAKAAGLSAVFDLYGWNEIGDGAFWDANEPPTPWNPLTDDGDALRLAVALRMRVHHDGSCAVVEIPTGQKYCWTEAAVQEDSDYGRATRRALVRAAAAIGEAMQ